MPCDLLGCAARFRVITTMTSVKKHSISALPLASSTHLLIHNLTPDPHTSSVDVFRSKVLTTNPSIQRRARVCPIPLIKSVLSLNYIPTASFPGMSLFIRIPNAYPIPIRHRSSCASRTSRGQGSIYREMAKCTRSYPPFHTE